MTNAGATPTAVRGEPNATSVLRLFEHLFDVFNRHHNGPRLILPPIEADELPHHAVEFLATAFAAYLRRELERADGRYAFHAINMSETLVLFSVNLSGRTYLLLDSTLADMPNADGVEGALLFHFLETTLLNVGHDIAFKVLEYRFSHHLLEAFFKAVALTLNGLFEACPTSGPVVLSKILDAEA